MPNLAGVQVARDQVSGESCISGFDQINVEVTQMEKPCKFMLSKFAIYSAVFY